MTEEEAVSIYQVENSRNRLRIVWKMFGRNFASVAREIRTSVSCLIDLAIQFNRDHYGSDKQRREKGDISLLFWQLVKT